MKNEKLELLLNKIVEFIQQDKHYKGFLYKSDLANENKCYYYIKVVENIVGSLVLNDIVVLNDGDEQYIIQADKPKLMRVSMKSWHYNLIKCVLRDNAPTPKTMQNGCPYFWLLLFSIIVFPFVLISKVLWVLISLFPKLFVLGLEKFVDLWIADMNDQEAYEVYRKGVHNTAPLTVKMFFGNNFLSDQNFINYFILEKYNLDEKINPIEYKNKKDEMRSKLDLWLEERSIKISEENNRIYKIEEEKRKKRIEREHNEAIRKAKWDARMKPFIDGFNKLGISITNIFTSISNQFKTNPANWKNIIKRTKQFVGGLITLILLGFTYVLVNAVVLIMTISIDWSIENWKFFAIFGLIAIAAGIVYVLYVFITGWVQNIVIKYGNGKKVWYFEPIRILCVYGLFYPVKFIIIVIAYGAFFIIIIPIKYVFYVFLWKVILSNLGIFIWNLIYKFVNGLIKSTGVFGEYFSASYTDYCPGLEWVDIDENQE